MPTLPDILLSVPVAEWIIKHVALSDWHDGPCMGFCELAHPACTFGYEVIAERPDNGSCGDRLFLLSACPSDAADRLDAVLNALAQGTLTKGDGDSQIDRLFDACTPTTILVQTRYFDTITALWQAADVPPLLPWIQGGSAKRDAG
jgi:hypothetical protein